MAVSISLSITQNSQSIANNTSNVTVKVNYSWDGSSHNTDPTTKYITINGTKYSFNDADINDNVTSSGSGTLYTKTLDIPHNSDGAGKVEVYAYVDTDISSGVLTKSASKTLTPIARKSTLDVSNGALGTEQTLKITRKVTTLTHTITFKSGTSSGTICTKSSSTTVYWTPPWSLARQNEGGSSVSVSLTITTYSGDTIVGSYTYTISCSIGSNSISGSNGTLGTSQTLTVTRKSTSLYHTITYKCGTSSGTIVSKGTSASPSWTPPWSLARQNEGGSSVRVAITIITYVKYGDYYYQVGASKSITLSYTINSNTISAPNGTIGSPLTITIGRQSTSLVHSVTYTCGSTSGTIWTKGTSEEIEWTPPWSLALQAAAKTSVSLTLKVITYIKVGDYYYQVGASKTKTITCNINSASMTVSSGTLGYEKTFTVTRAGSYYHTIQCKCDGTTYDVAVRSTATSITWTPPVSLASSNPNGTTVTVEFTIRTWSTATVDTGSQIGAIRTVTKTFDIPSTVKPTVTLTVSDAEGHLSKYGKYVWSKSKLDFNVDASGSYGSTITSTTTTFAGRTYTAESGTIESLPIGDGNTITTTVKDTRNRTATASKTINVYDYGKPKITKLTVRRCNSAGTSSASGAYLAVDFGGSVTSLGSKNSAKYTVQYKKTTATSYTKKEFTDIANTYSVSSKTFVFAADTDSTYDIILKIEDDFDSVTKKAVGQSIKHFWSVYAKGKGFAFGKIAELLETFEVGWKARFYKEVQFDASTTFKGNTVVEGIMYNTLPIDTDGIITADRVTNVSVNCRHDYGRKRVDFTFYGLTNSTFNTGYNYDLFTVPSAHKPNRMYALTAFCSKNIAVRINSDGVVQLRPYESLGTGYDLYITGFWYTD